MPILNKPDMNYGVWAEGGNIEIPSSEKVYEGWVVEKPLNETMNWIQNRQDRMLQYINERGIPEWDARTEYPLDSYVARSGVIYKALSPSTDKDPTLHTNIWQIAFVSQVDFDNYSDKINKIENEEGYLGLYVSKSEPVMTGAARGLSYNDSEIKAGLGFEGGVAKIHKDLNVVAEFSGGTNPKDVVTHEQLALAIQVFKVGSLYTTTVDENPNTTFGYGTWERFGKGKALVGFSDEISNEVPQWVKYAGSTFGTFTHKLDVSEMPRHNHAYQIAVESSGAGGGIDTGTSKAGYLRDNIDFEGGDKPHNNVQPSIVVYFWKRTS